MTYIKLDIIQNNKLTNVAKEKEVLLLDCISDSQRSKTETKQLNKLPQQDLRISHVYIHTYNKHA